MRENEVRYNPNPQETTQKTKPHKASKPSLWFYSSVLFSRGIVRPSSLLCNSVCFKPWSQCRSLSWLELEPDLAWALHAARIPPSMHLHMLFFLSFPRWLAVFVFSDSIQPWQKWYPAYTRDFLRVAQGPQAACGAVYHNLRLHSSTVRMRLVVLLVETSNSYRQEPWVYYGSPGHCFILSLLFFHSLHKYKQIENMIWSYFDCVCLYV